MTMKTPGETKGLLGTLMYLAFGLMIYVVLFQPETGFTWANPWVYIVAVFWPFALIYKFTVAILVLIAIAVVIGFIFRKAANWRGSRSNGDTPDFR